MEQCSTGHRVFDPGGQKSQGHDDSQQGLQDLLLQRLGLQTASYPYIPAALEIGFERRLHLYGEGYDNDSSYNLPQPLKKTTHIYVVTAVAETSLDPMGHQGSGMHALISTSKGMLVELSLQQMAHICLNLGNPPPSTVDPNNNEGKYH